jgi:hypothetical protein
MRFQVVVRPEDEAPLQRLAFSAHRSVREQAEFLLHLKINEEVARRNLEPETEPEAVA